MGGQPGTNEGENKVLGHNDDPEEVEVLSDGYEVEVLRDGEEDDGGESEQQLWFDYGGHQKSPHERVLIFVDHEVVELLLIEIDVVPGLVLGKL